MELRTIRYFLAVAEHGSLSAAAKAVYVTQPSLSRQMVELERELGSSLFRRTASGLKLNHAGRRFLPMAIDIEQRAQRSGEVMRSLSGAPLNLVAACAVTVAQHILAPFIADTGAPIADVREFDPTVVYTPLESGVADLAMGTVRPPAGFIGRRLALGYLSLQFPPGDTFSGRSTVDIREVADRDLIVVRRGSSIRSILDASAERADLQLQYALQVSSSTIAQRRSWAGLSRPTTRTARRRCCRPPRGTGWGRRPPLAAARRCRRRRPCSGRCDRGSR